MASALCPLGILPNNQIAGGPRVLPPRRILRAGNTLYSQNMALKRALGGNVRRSAAVSAVGKAGIVASASGIENPFKYERPMEGLQGPLAGLPTAGVYVVGALLMAALGATGMTVAGQLAPESLKSASKAAGAALGAAVGGFLTTKLKAIRETAAAIELSNLLVTLGDPSVLTRDAVLAIENKYGTSLAASSLEDLKTIYGTFVEAMIPAGDAPLSGVEAPLVVNFKNALGLTDVDAAPVHMDVGRRILRGRMESSTRGEDTEARKTFQKLIYVSNLVFGERQSAFLLPWSRVFGLNEATVQVARRDNARALFKRRVEAEGLRAERSALAGLKSYAVQVRLADDEATTVIVEAAQGTLEKAMERAIECIKRRSRVRDFSDAVSAVREAVDFNRAMAALKGDPEVPAGVGAASLAGTPWEAAEGRSKDLRELFRVYLEECLARDAAFTDALEADAADLRTIAGLGTKEAASIEDDVKEKTYKALLRDEVKSGRLEAAPSKAEVLGDLVDKVRWDTDAAMELHRSLYRQKLSSLLEKKSLTADDDAELARLQRLLCVTTDDRNAMHKELCGGIFREVVNRAMSGGIDDFQARDMADVKSAFESLRLDRAVSKEIVEEVGRKYLLQFVTTSRNQRDRILAARELRKMVFFSNIVVAPLVDLLKTDEERQKEEDEARQQKELQEMMAKAREEAAKEKAAEEAAAEPAKSAEEAEVKAETGAEAEAEQKDDEEASEAEAESAPAAEDAAAAEALVAAAEAAAAEEAEATPKSLEKAQSAAAKRSTGERLGGDGAVMKSQKDVTLAKDLELRDRLDIYKNFLLYCMTGEVVQGPMGVQMVTERDESEFARLSQLGDVLGLTQMDVYTVHQGLAEQAFKSQVQQVMGDGVLTESRAASLESVRAQMGLPKEAADKIIKGLQNQKLISSMQAAKAQGNLTLDKVLELKDAGVEPSSLMTPDGLAQLYRGEVAARLTDGSGNFDPERMLQQLPADLGMAVGAAGKVVKELAGERKRTTLVQAVSFLRQKNVGETVKSLNNLRACVAALPDAGAEKWSEADEVADLYSLYCSKESDEARRAGVQTALGLSDEDAATLKSIAEAGQFKLGQEAEEEAASIF